MGVKKAVEPMRGPVWKAGPNGTVVDCFTGQIAFACGPADRDATEAEERTARAVASLADVVERAEQLVKELTPCPGISVRPTRSRQDKLVRELANALAFFRREMPARR